LLTKEEKRVIVEDLKQMWTDSKSFVFYSFEKMNAADITKLRKELRAQKVKAYVAKNNLIALSAKLAGIDLDKNLSDSIFSGQTGIVASQNDPLTGPKTVNNFYRENNKPVIKGGFFEGKLLTIDQVIMLASVPPLEVLQQRLAYAVLSPVTKVASGLQNVAAKIVYVLNAVKEQKEKIN